jgi:hypothetical protein
MSNIIIKTLLQLWQNNRKIKRAGSGWLSGNAVCCPYNNQRQDRRGRGGVILENDKLSYSCFNCNYKTGYRVGGPLTPKFKDLLRWLGATNEQIDKLTIEGIRIREEIEGVQGLLKREQNYSNINFKQTRLPEGSVLVDAKNPEHQIYIDRLRERGLSLDDYKFYCTPTDEGRNKDRIIIPYYHRGMLVGNTSRYYDDRKPKYIADRQRGYVFNIDAQTKHRQVCIIVEGEFDAIAIGGCAFMSSAILDEQAAILSRLHRQIILVPDRDDTGMGLCDRALELGYKVALPDWDDSIKDVNDAVKKYGRLATTLSIIQSATTNKVKIEMTRKRYK